MDFVPRTVMIGGKVLATMFAKAIFFDWVCFSKHVIVRETCCFVTVHDSCTWQPQRTLLYDLLLLIPCNIIHSDSQQEMHHSLSRSFFCCCETTLCASCPVCHPVLWGWVSEWLCEPWLQRVFEIWLWSLAHPRILFTVSRADSDNKRINWLHVLILLQNWYFQNEF